MTAVFPAIIPGLPGGSEWIVILLLALLFFGNRLPSVARNLGSGIVEFKRGLKSGEDDVSKTNGASGSADTPSASSKQDA